MHISGTEPSSVILGQKKPKDVPGGNKVKILQKSLSPTFWPPPNPEGQVMSVKCKDSIDELTVQVWLLYQNPNLKYCTLFVSGTELRTDGLSDY